jgi:hypothetical protein
MSAHRQEISSAPRAHFPLHSAAAWSEWSDRAALEVHRRPEREGPEHRVARDAQDAARLPAERALAPGHRWVRRGDRGDEEHEGDEHDEREDPAQPAGRVPQRGRGRGVVARHQEPERADRDRGEQAAEWPLADPRDDRAPRRRAGDAEMRADPDQRREPQRAETLHRPVSPPARQPAAAGVARRSAVSGLDNLPP